MNVSIRYARIVTPVYTYVKHSFATDDGSATARVVNPRTHEQFAELADVTVTEVPTDARRGGRFYRVEGTNPEGVVVRWSISDQGCGCRVAIRIVDTDPADIPT